MSDKATERNGVATAIDPRQLELVLEVPEREDGSTTAGGRDAERAQEIVSSLDHLSSEEVFEAFEELDALPPDVVRAALAPTTGPAPDPEALDDATRRAHGFPPRPLHLRTIAAVKDADIFDVGSVAEEQLRIAGRSWDGRDLAAEDRLDGEVEGSFAGTLEHRVLADASSLAPLFDVLTYAGDSGSIFRSGTAELVGAIAGMAVEMRDRRARAAIQEALAEKTERISTTQLAVEEVVEPLVEAQPVVEAPPVVKKKSAKTAAKKKASTKTAAAKTPKRSAAKKTAAKRSSKAAASAAAAPAKKSTVKSAKAPEKKPTSKRASSKKGSKKTDSDE